MENDTWRAYQFHKEDLGQGMVLAFHRPGCSLVGTNLKLWGVSPEANYEIHFEDSGQRQTLSGIDIIIESQPGFALITYCQSQ